jgi:hypothetical protein
MYSLSNILTIIRNGERASRPYIEINCIKDFQYNKNISINNNMSINQKCKKKYFSILK